MAAWMEGIERRRGGSLGWRDGIEGGCRERSYIGQDDDGNWKGRWGSAVRTRGQNVWIGVAKCRNWNGW